MLDAPAIATAAVGGVPFLPHADARVGPGVRSSRLDAIIKRRDAIVERAGESVRDDLARLADELGKRVVDMLADKAGGDPLRLAVDTTSLDEILDLLYELGVNDSQRAWFDHLRELAGLAEDAALAVGMERDAVSLDQEALASALEARYQDAATWWDATIERPLAQTILDGLHDARALTSTAEIAERISNRARISIPAAWSEATTQTAVVDRFVSAEIAQSADPDGDALRWAYLGPVDGIQRRFCQHLTGRYFRFADLGALDNGTALPHPIYSGGGYRCRHRWAQAPAAFWKARGLAEGTAGDVAAANAGARR
jgi:hypothetical protein